jgi:hypothetical protein
LLIRTERIIKIGLLAETDLDHNFICISIEQAIVDRCATLVEMQC